MRPKHQATPAAPDLFADGTLVIGEAMRFSGLGRSSLYGLMDRGELVYTVLSGRRLIPRRALVELLARGAAGREVEHAGACPQ